MGGSVSHLIGRLICRKPYRIAIFGLDAAGKTSFLYRLKTNTLVQTIPTIGFNVELIHLKYSDVTMWDVGGGDKIHPLWRHYYDGANGIVFVLDASDKERAPQAADEFHYLLSSTTNTDHVVLILANKQDLEDCLTEEEITEIFRLRTTSAITWHIQPASVKESYGLTEAMEWLSKALFGLDGVGKTCLLYRLKTKNFVETIPTVGSNVELINLKYCDILMWDVGGGDKIKPLWRHYFEGTNGIVFILDATDRERVSEAAFNFHSLITSTSNMAQIVLILANKQDLGKNCMTDEEIIEIFNLRENQIPWRLQPVSIKEWYGVSEAMEWLSKEICK